MATGLSERTLKYYKDLAKKNPDRDKDAMARGIEYFHREGNKTEYLRTADELEYTGRRRMELSPQGEGQPQETEKESGDFVTGLKRGIDQTQGMLYGGTALAGRAMEGL